MKSNVGLLPADDTTREWYGKLRLGVPLHAKITQPRDVVKHRRFFALLNLAFEHWADTAPAVEYKGQPVQPDFERFRKDITILAGKYKPVVNIKGEIRIEADSIAFNKMSQEEFEQLYSQTITVLIGRVFKGPQWNEARIRELVEQIGGFA